MANDQSPPRAKPRGPTTDDDGMANHHRPTTNDGGGGKKNFFVTLARYSQLAFVLPGCTVVGWLIGVALDHWLHKNWIYLVGLIAGIAAGFIELVRTVMSAESKN
jgi:Putative F0F1-ATPase subunit Ca2+/Mg2+ transporter